MINTLNDSERFVYNVCQKSFLSIWSFASPQGKNSSQELCDILIVCAPHVIVLSVKGININKSSDPVLDAQRWQRKAIDASIKQIKGAVRFLEKATYLVGKDGNKVQLPPQECRIYHQIVVAFGGQREVPIASFSKENGGFFHVTDEASFFLLLRHLDTISDFVEYLTKKEKFLEQSTAVILGGEENFLALYLNNNREFPEISGTFIIDNTLWEGFSEKPEFLKKLEKDKESYIWDRLIEGLCTEGKQPWQTQTYGSPDLDVEKIFRVMVMEHRFSRRLLGKAFDDFLLQAKEKKLDARCIKSLNNVVYVFYCYEKESSLESRRAVLLARCFASLDHFGESSVIIGIGLNVPDEQPDGGYTPTIVMVQTDEGGRWPDEFCAHAKKCREEFGYFNNEQKILFYEDEYPEIK